VVRRAPFQVSEDQRFQAGGPRPHTVRSGQIPSGKPSASGNTSRSCKVSSGATRTCPSALASRRAGATACVFHNRRARRLRLEPANPLNHRGPGAPPAPGAARRGRRRAFSPPRAGIGESYTTACVPACLRRCAMCRFGHARAYVYVMLACVSIWECEWVLRRVGEHVWVCVSADARTSLCHVTSCVLFATSSTGYTSACMRT